MDGRIVGVTAVMLSRNRFFLKSAAAALGIFILVEVFMAPVLGSLDVRRLWKNGPEKDGSQAVLDILRENRTGLGSVEETRLARIIAMESVAHKIDPLFILALIQTESTYYNWSKSLSGALGLMQILPSTGRALADEMNLKWRGNETLLNPFVNVRMGIHYFSSLKEQFNDDTVATLAAYNVGPTYLLENKEAGFGVTEGFVKRVLDNYREIKERVESH